MAFPHIDTPSGGLLTAADLDMARRESTGRIYHLHRAAFLPAGDDFPEPHMAACAPEGGMHAEPVPSGTHRQSLLSRGWLRLLRVLG